MKMLKILIILLENLRKSYRLIDFKEIEYILRFYHISEMAKMRIICCQQFISHQSFNNSIVFILIIAIHAFFAIQNQNECIKYNWKPKLAKVHFVQTCGTAFEIHNLCIGCIIGVKSFHRLNISRTGRCDNKCEIISIQYKN